MKLFRKIKYRLRRFIISLISVLCLCSVFVVSASADVLPVSPDPVKTSIQPYYWNGTEWVYSDSVEFIPGRTINTGLNTPQGNAFGMTFTISSTTPGTTIENPITLNTGVLHFRISFDTNHYFTSRLPYINFFQRSFDENGQVYFDSETLESEYFDFDYSVKKLNPTTFNVITDIYIDSKYAPFSDLYSFYFYLQRDSAAGSVVWSITPRLLTLEILTGPDVPKYSQPDTSAKNELDSVEGELNDSINSFGSDIGSIFSFDDLYDLVVPGITFWGTTLEDFFNLDFVRPILILSLACGIFSLLFGLVGTLVSRSNNKQSQAKSNKSKGG